MDTRVWARVGAATVFAMQLGTGLAADHHGAKAPAHAAHSGHWDYTGPTGPAKWAQVDEKFATCAMGKTQSPIDIRSKEAKSGTLPPIQFDYKTSALKIVDNGHTIQVNYEPGSSITVDGRRYELLQFHFHRPSEERIDGKAFDMVAHLVHKNDAGQLAVVGVLIQKGSKRPVMQAVFDNLPAKKGEELTVPGVAIDINALLPEKKSYYTFEGSLTTPPCSEGVTWYVLKQPVQASASQLASFAKVYPMNARPVQPQNGRAISVSE